MRHVRDCLNAPFKELYTRSQQTEQLTHALKKHLPDLLQDHCQVISYQRGCLRIATSNASFATQLRYLLPELRDQLRQQEAWRQLGSIDLIIEDNPPTPILQQSKPKQPKDSRWHLILKLLKNT